MGKNGSLALKMSCYTEFLPAQNNKVLIWAQGVLFLVSSVLLLSLGKEMSVIRMFKNHNKFQLKLKRSCSWTGKDLEAARKENAKARKKSWMRRQVGEEWKFMFLCSSQSVVEGWSWLRLLSWDDKGWERGERSRWTRSKCIERMQGFPGRTEVYFG